MVGEAFLIWSLLTAPPTTEKFPDRSEARAAEELRQWHLNNERIRDECVAQGGYIWELKCVLPAPPPQPTAQTPAVAYTASGGLVGQVGWAIAGGNCINMPGVNNPGWGSPINWPATGFNPWIGASALFNFNHVGIVVGIWPNGDLEIAHMNWQGNQHQFPRYMIRGFR